MFGNQADMNAVDAFAAHMITGTLIGVGLFVFYGGIALTVYAIYRVIKWRKQKNRYR